MSGGAYEYVAAYVDNGDRNITIYGSPLVNATEKYKDVYSKGSSDDRDSNYAMSTPNNKHYGDAIWEISSSGSGTNSWYSDYSNFPYSRYPFFFRGGNYYDTSNVGVFSFYNYTGEYNVYYGFRVVVPVL